MKYLIFSDTHCTRASEFSQPTEDGFNEYIDLWRKSLGFVTSLAEEHKPNVVVFCGDLWDARDYVDTMALAAAVAAFRDFSSSCRNLGCDLLAVVGNHDYYSVKHNIHTLVILEAFGWKVADSISTLAVGSQEASEDVLCIPFRDSYGDDLLEEIAATSAEVVFSHCDVVGGRFRAPRSESDVRAYCSEGVDPSIFEGKVVFNGHFHHPSQVSSSFYNIGSLTTRTFHDKGSDPRGAVVYDASTGALQSFSNPHAREFCDYWISSEDDVAALASEDLSRIYARVHYAPELVSEAQALQEFFAGSRLIPVARRVDRIEEGEKVDTSFSLEDNLTKYIEEIYAEGSFRDLLLSSAQDLLKQVISGESLRELRLPLEFGELEVEHFQSLGRIKVDLRRRGLVFIRGENNDDPEQDDNGSGKSSFIEAIYWILTGKSLRGYSVNDVIHWDYKFCYGSLQLFAGDEEYTVVRTRKHPELKTGVYLYKGADKADVGARLSTDTELKLTELIGRSEENLRHVCFLTSDFTHKFTALRRDAKVRLLEDIVGSQPYSAAQDAAKEIVKVHRSQLQSVRGSVETFGMFITRLESRIETTQTELDEFVAAHEARLAEMQSELAALERRKVAIQEEAAVVSKEEAELADTIEKLSSKYSAYLKDIAAKERSAAPAKMSLGAILHEIKRVNNLLAKESCPTCGAPIQAVSYQSQLSELNTQRAELQATISSTGREAQQLEHRAEKIQQLLTLRTNLRSSLETKLQFKRRELQTVSLRIVDTQHDVSRLGERKQSLLKTLVTAKEELASTRKELEGAELRAVELERSIEVFAELQHEVFDEQGVRKAFLSRVAVPFINDRLPIYADYLLGGKQLTLTEEELELYEPGPRTYLGCSSGERRRRDLLLQFALNDLAVATGRSKIGFLAIDEVLDKLDERGLYAVKRVLEIKSEDMTVLAVSHSKYAASIAQSKYILSKRNGVTSLRAMQANSP